MSLKINTNIAALNAHRNMLKTDSGLSKSLERLSSGLRINKAADDASGMAIADSLKAQALGLGQAISNANDAVNVIQTADGALEESINIVNTIRTKALQAASDGQNSDSRAAIQRDINKLLGSLNNIADTTSFNGQTLLKGGFQNKFFQVGAYANQTINVSIANADASHVGKLATIDTTSTQTNLINVDSSDSNFVARAATDLQDGIFAQVVDNDLKLNGYAVGGNLAGQGVEQLSAKGVAAAINHMTGDTDVSATAETTWTGTGSIAGGSIADGGLVINGVNIGPVSVVANDADGALQSAINAHTGSTGVSASVSSTGILTLSAADGSNIALYNGGTYAADSFTSTLGAGFVDNRSVLTLSATYAGAGTKYINIGGNNYSFTAASGTTTTQDNLYAAIDTELGSDYTVTQASSGAAIVITRTDGKDINFISDSDGTYASISAQLYAADGTTTVGNASVDDSVIGNNSQHGTVTLTSDSNISLTGDADTMASYGFNHATSQTQAATGGIIDADVTSFSAAQITVQRADSALTSLDTIRSQLGSAQNQVESTLRNITVTQVNVTSSESGIRDVDFAAESANFAKFQVLAQSGSFAMAQSNASLQNVLRLLQ